MRMSPWLLIEPWYVPSMKCTLPCSDAADTVHTVVRWPSARGGSDASTTHARSCRGCERRRRRHVGTRAAAARLLEPTSPGQAIGQRSAHGCRSSVGAHGPQPTRRRPHQVMLLHAFAFQAAPLVGIISLLYQSLQARGEARR